jgi:uncharacterized membrane protein
MGELKDRLIYGIIEGLNQMPPEFIVMMISSFPVLELRGGIPTAIGYYQFPFWKAYFWGVLGNMLPVMPLLLLFQPISNVLNRFGWYRRFYNWLVNRVMKKSKNINRYGALALILFTAIPLPTTGAWSACAAATVFKLRIAYSFYAILIGVLIAGLIMGIFSYSIFG